MLFPRILSVCSDAQLAITRHEVLTQQFLVTTAVGLQDLDRIAADFDPAVVIVCHTLPDEQCALTASIVRRRWPAAKVLALTSIFHSCASAYPDLALAGVDGPTRLLAAVERLARQDGHPAMDGIAASRR